MGYDTIKGHGVAYDTVPASSYLEVKSDSPVKIYKKVGYPNIPDSWTLLKATQAFEIYRSAAFSAATEIRIEASAAMAYYEIGTAPQITEPLLRTLTRTTIADAGTVTAAQVLTGILYQDASGGAVTMTSPTAALMDAAVDLSIGGSFDMYVASNHATNTSTISGGTGVTVVGSGAVTNTGGHFKWIKTAATPTYDLVRVG